MRKRRTEENIARRKRLRELEATPVQEGDKVRYRGLVGVVVEAWGVFYACRECTKLLDNKRSVCCREKDGRGIKARIISGEGIFEVLFDDGQRALNRWWLEKV